MSTIIDFDTIVRRLADPSAPVDASIRQTIAAGGVDYLVAELHDMLEDGEACPELEERARALASRTLTSPAAWTVDIDPDAYMYREGIGWDCYLLIEPEELRVTSWARIGRGMPGHVHKRRAIMVGVRTRTDGEALREIFESDEGRALLARVSMAYRGAHWDGSNLVGRWDGEALERIERLLEDTVELVPLRADADFIIDWWGHSCESLASTFAEIIAGGVTVPDAIRQLVEEARDMDVILDEETMRDAIEADITQRLEELTEAIDEEEDDDERAELGEELVLVASAAKVLGEVA